MKEDNYKKKKEEREQMWAKSKKKNRKPIDRSTYLGGTWGQTHNSKVLK